MVFSIIPIDQVDIPYADLRKEQPEIERYSAGAIIYCQHPEPLVLLFQRAPIGRDENGCEKKNSWPFTWEWPQGGREGDDKTALETALREAAEEANLHGHHVSRQVYRSTWIYKGALTATYVFPMDVTERLHPRRIWSYQRQQPIGTTDGPISLQEYETLDFCWVTEDQVRTSLQFDEART
ncbi:hypothetical protein CBS147326_2830 [Penicillium roqueforti]|nr:hypothetical protein CBS147326_2830 [Penicillium roqueforti]